MKVAIVQMCSGADPYENLLVIDAFVREAQERDADLVCFPENVFYRGPKKSEDFDRSEICLSLSSDDQLQPTHEFARALSEIMQGWSIAVSLGSVLECSAGAEHPFNTHLLRTADGRLVAYRKMHLFAFRGRHVHYDEARDVLPGTSPLDTSVGGVKVGLSICYDLRFPELFRELILGRGAQVLLVPAAFARETGEAHWHALLRARAIENHAFVVASGQTGFHLDSRGQHCECYGHSVIYGPWGETVAEFGREEEGLLVADRDMEA